jgi:DNA modification methylase
MNQILQGNALTVLRELDGETIDTCVTSPPYYGLRDYGTSRWTGGIADCDHTVKEIRTGLGLADSPASVRGGGHKVKSIPKIQAKKICPKCGAIRIDNQIGLEETPEEYISRLVEVFREVRRVLKNDGTLWVNIGDSYAGSGKGGAKYPGSAGQMQSTNKGMIGSSAVTKVRWGDCKPKDLIGIPWRLAFALRDDGWYLRQDIIWHKPNGMPESVKDRCTKSHEYIFLLSKSPRYHFDSRAIEEPAAYDGRKATLNKGSGKYSQSPIVPGKTIQQQSMAGKPHERWREKNGIYVRNKRDVWTVSTKPYSGAHFATFPPELIRPCVLAGSRPGGIVLDPFCGSGTTGLVAVQEGRGYALIDLNPEYVDMTRKRIEEQRRKVSLFEVAE